MIKFLADACLNQGIVEGCIRCEPLMDFLSANEASLEGVADPDVLALAAQEDRILVTSDLRTMPYHFGAHLATYGSSPGVVLVSNRWSIGTAVDALVLIWNASDADEWRDSIADLSRLIQAR